MNHAPDIPQYMCYKIQFIFQHTDTEEYSINFMLDLRTIVGVLNIRLSLYKVLTVHPYCSTISFCFITVQTNLQLSSLSTLCSLVYNTQYPVEIYLEKCIRPQVCRRLATYATTLVFSLGIEANEVRNMTMNYVNFRTATAMFQGGASVGKDRLLKPSYFP